MVALQTGHGEVVRRGLPISYVQVIFRTVSLCLALVVDEVLPVRKQMSVGPNFDSSIRRIERKAIVVVGWCRGLERGRNVDRKAVSVIAEALPIGGLRQGSKTDR